MGKKNKKVQHKKETQREKVNVALRNVLTGITEYYESKFPDKKCDLKNVLNSITTDKLASTIEDPESELFCAIPIDSLKETEEGIALLETLNVIVDMPHLTLENKMRNEAKKDLASTLTDSLITEIPDDIKNLAVELQQQLQLPDDIDSIADIDFGDLFSRVSLLMEEKTKRGEIDMDKLHNQSKELLSQAEANPIFQQMLNNKDALSKMMK